MAMASSSSVLEDDRFSNVLIAEKAADTAVDEGNSGLATEPARIDGCDGDGRLLEVKKKQLLDEIEEGSMFGGGVGVGVSEERTLVVENLPNGCLRSSLMIEMIDESAVIEPITGPGFSIGIAKKNNNCSKENPEGKKSKRAKRRGKAKGETSSVKVDVNSVVYRKNEGDGTKRVYSKEMMEALRFVEIVKQRKLWKKIFDGLEPEVAKDYLSLTAPKQQNSTSEASKSFRMPHGPGILGEVSSENVEGETSSSGAASGLSLNCDYESANLEDDGDEDSEDSDEYYASIQRPAFYVEGEPNFDAGPPEDGLEYLRRVRWEAKQFPKVHVAKIDESKLNKEQSVYMPVIPEIARCPEHLMPSKEWEDEFLADFSKLRVAFSEAESLKVETSENSQVKLVFGGGYLLNHLAVLGNLESQAPNEERQAAADVHIDTPKVESSESSSASPTLTKILSMSPVSRVSSLRKRISALEAATELSKEDCLWIFALCAAIDTPLHGDTSASLRDLLRKCASLRAQKEQPDDEAVMLNILATISGKFFGQSDM